MNRNETRSEPSLGEEVRRLEVSLARYRRLPCENEEEEDQKRKLLVRAENLLARYRRIKYEVVANAIMIAVFIAGLLVFFLSP